MKYLLSHRTSYTYASSVDSAHHIAHLRARAFPARRSPRSASRPTRRRRWQCSISTISATTSTSIASTSRIPASTSRCAPRSTCAFPIRRPPPRRRRGKRCAPALDGDGFPCRSRPASSCYDSPLVPAVEALKAYGAKSFTPGRPILAAARELTSRIKADFEYHPAPPTSARRSPRSSPARRASARISPIVEIAALRAHGLAAALRLGLHPHRPLQGRDRAARRRCQPRLGRGVVRRGRGLGPSRSDQRSGGQGRTTSPSPGAATSPT